MTLASIGALTPQPFAYRVRTSVIPVRSVRSSGSAVYCDAAWPNVTPRMGIAHGVCGGGTEPGYVVYGAICSQRTTGSEPGRAAAEVLCQPDALPARYMSERRLDRNSMRSADR